MDLSGSLIKPVMIKVMWQFAIHSLGLLRLKHGTDYGRKYLRLLRLEGNLREKSDKAIIRR